MPQLSIIIPTRNEEGNINQLVGRINKSLNGKDYEIVVVDDSQDKTAELAAKIGCRVIIGKRKGLGQAIIDGITAAQGNVVVVMDADGSHRPEEITRLLHPILAQGYEFTIGSRYVKGGDSSGWTKSGRIKSLLGAYPQWLVTGILDSNSGFFAFKKSILDGVLLNAGSWKIMLEVAFKAHYTARLEVPITFDKRLAGKSKNNTKERIRHAKHLINLLVWKFPKRYVSFALVGGGGAVMYFILFWLITEKLHIWYGVSYFIATAYAIVQNYFLNHWITFRKHKHNNDNHLKGIWVYTLGSAVGESVEYGIMIFLTEIFGVWYILSDFIGSGFSSVIKYTIARKKVWKDTEKRTSSSADYEWHAFFKGLPWQKRWKRIIAKIVKEFAEDKTGNAGRLLDIGCGSSPTGLLIKHNDYVGIDGNADKIAYMKAKGLIDCEYKVADITNLLPMIHQGRKFDTIICIEVIEHLQSKEAVKLLLNNMYGSLRSQGRLVLATPNFGSFTGQWMDRLYGIFQKNAYQEEHQTKFSVDELRNLAAAMGFRHLKSRIPSGADMVCLFEKGE